MCYQVKIHKFLKLVLCTIFIYTNCFHFTIQASQNSINSGKIISSYSGKENTPNVFIIQDLHCHGASQKKISNILKSIKDQNNDRFQVVGIEGSSGIIDTSIVRNLPSKEFKESILEKFVASGYINGAELYDIQNPTSIILYGVESKKLYNKNLKQLKEVFLSDKKYEGILKKIKHNIFILQKKYYSENIKNIEKKYKFYNKSKISLYKLLNYLKSLSSPSTYFNINLYLKVQEKIKNIDNKKLRNEIEYCLKRIDKYLTQEDKNNLIKKKKNKFKYYKEVINIIEQKNVKNIKKSFPTIYEYQSFLKLNENINELLLSEEIKEYVYETKLASTLCLNEKNIIMIDRYVQLIEAYLSNNISSKGAGALESGLNEFYELIEDLNINIDIKDLKEKIEKAQLFYMTAKKRDEIIISNLLKYVSKTSSRQNNVVALVVGGFHSDGIKDYLKARGCSYTVIVPDVKSGKYDKNLYYKRIGESRGIEK